MERRAIMLPQMRRTSRGLDQSMEVSNYTTFSGMLDVCILQELPSLSLSCIWKLAAISTVGQ